MTVLNQHQAWFNTPISKSDDDEEPTEETQEVLNQAPSLLS